MECPNDEGMELEYSSEIGWYCPVCGFNHKGNDCETKPKASNSKDND
jgi:hypothetical protein